jgi:hypothetical protein
MVLPVPFIAAQGREEQGVGLEMREVGVENKKRGGWHFEKLG